MPKPVAGEACLNCWAIFPTWLGGRFAPPASIEFSDDRLAPLAAAASRISADMVGTPQNRVICSDSMRSTASAGSHRGMSTTFPPAAKVSKKQLLVPEIWKKGTVTKFDWPRGWPVLSVGAGIG